MTEEKRPEPSGEEPRAGGGGSLISLRPTPAARLWEILGRGGRTMPAVALVLALAATIAAVYLWKELAQTRARAALTEDTLSERIASLQESEGRQAAELSRALKGTEEAALQDEAIKRSIDELRGRLTRDRSEWILAEVDYLLSLAGQRLTLEQDVPTAIAALEAADGRLQALDEPILLSVREAIAREVQALRRLPSPDRPGLALQLGELAGSAAELPVAEGLLNRGDRAASPAETSDRGFFAAIWEDIKGLVTIHRRGELALPLLPVEQRYFLRQNLVLKLETARLALLRREPALYKATLAEAEGWVARYFDPRDARVRSLADAIAMLKSQEIAPELPDISGSRQRLQRVLHRFDQEARLGGRGE